MNDNKKEEENIPDPIFHTTENFNSAYFGKVPDEIVSAVPQKYDRKLIATLVSQLTKPESPEIKEEVLKVLREGESQELLVEIIGMKEYAKHRKIIIAACWECGLDFSSYLDSFVALLGEKSTDEFTCLEISTVIEEMIGPIDAKIIEKNLELIDSYSINEPLKKDLLAIIILKLKSFLPVA
jgi:hypothetical protein